MSYGVKLAQHLISPSFTSICLAAYFLLIITFLIKWGETDLFSKIQ